MAKDNKRNLLIGLLLLGGVGAVILGMSTGKKTTTPPPAGCVEGTVRNQVFCPAPNQNVLNTREVCRSGVFVQETVNVCPGVNHLECRGGVCTSIAGGGGNLDGCVAGNDPCGAVSHLECQGGRCVSVAGGGANDPGCNVVNEPCVVPQNYTVQFRIEDGRGFAALPNATVEVVGVGTLQTDGAGNVIFNNVPRGDYVVNVSLAGYQPYTFNQLVDNNDLPDNWCDGFVCGRPITLIPVNAHYECVANNCFGVNGGGPNLAGCTQAGLPCPGVNELDSYISPRVLETIDSMILYHGPGPVGRVTRLQVSFIQNGQNVSIQIDRSGTSTLQPNDGMPGFLEFAPLTTNHDFGEIFASVTTTNDGNIFIRFYNPSAVEPYLGYVDGVLEARRAALNFEEGNGVAGGIFRMLVFNSAGTLMDSLPANVGANQPVSFATPIYNDDIFAVVVVDANDNVHFVWLDII
ncbi:MAG: carboxypeptidase-like regulatory domain-containing protein [Candidatus Daviesbacteria bacterium]|nr:carboxypeptidase-like regulatory domain-containing protein [Candidatus Daviesbacteria bacterium]